MEYFRQINGKICFKASKRMSPSPPRQSLAKGSNVNSWSKGRKAYYRKQTHIQILNPHTHTTGGYDILLYNPSIEA